MVFLHESVVWRLGKEAVADMRIIGNAVVVGMIVSAFSCCGDRGGATFTSKEPLNTIPNNPMEDRAALSLQSHSPQGYRETVGQEMKSIIEKIVSDKCIEDQFALSDNLNSGEFKSVVVGKERCGEYATWMIGNDRKIQLVASMPDSESVVEIGVNRSERTAFARESSRIEETNVRGRSEKYYQCRRANENDGIGGKWECVQVGTIEITSDENHVNYHHIGDKGTIEKCVFDDKGRLIRAEHFMGDHLLTSVNVSYSEKNRWHVVQTDESGNGMSYVVFWEDNKPMKLVGEDGTCLGRWEYSNHLPVEYVFAPEWKEMSYQQQYIWDSRGCVVEIETRRPSKGNDSKDKYKVEYKNVTNCEEIPANVKQLLWTQLGLKDFIFYEMDAANCLNALREKSGIGVSLFSLGR